MALFVYRRYYPSLTSISSAVPLADRIILLTGPIHGINRLDSPQNQFQSYQQQQNQQQQQQQQLYSDTSSPTDQSYSQGYQSPSSTKLEKIKMAVPGEVRLNFEGV